jgi:hypothetical protein
MQIALIAGVCLAVASIPLPTLVALAVGLAAAAVLGYSFPDEATRVGVAVAAPILTVAFVVGLVRGFSFVVLAIFLLCSLVLPVGIARVGAQARRGK